MYHTEPVLHEYKISIYLPFYTTPPNPRQDKSMGDMSVTFHFWAIDVPDAIRQLCAVYEHNEDLPDVSKSIRWEIDQVYFDR